MGFTVGISLAGAIQAMRLRSSTASGLSPYGSMGYLQASQNPTWGAPTIHGELLMLGFDVSERTFSRYLPRRPPRSDAVVIGDN
jgi:hypothetical protein